MILRRKHGSIICGTEKRIAFAINSEGNNDFVPSCTAIAREFWPELLLMSNIKIGTVLSKEVDGITYFALCCYSLERGWENQQEIIKKCFDSIPGSDPIASVDIGSGWLEKSSGANIYQIRAGMQASTAEIILYLN